MLKIDFKMNGRSVAPNRIREAFTKAVMKHVDRSVEKWAEGKAQSMRCPRHGRTGRVVRRDGQLYIAGCCPELGGGE